MNNKKILTLLTATLLMLATATAGLAADTTSPPIADTYTIDGVTYYNVNSPNFDSTKKFYKDVFNAKHASLGGRSIGELWMLAAVGMKDTAVSSYAK